MVVLVCIVVGGLLVMLLVVCVAVSSWLLWVLEVL